MAAPHALVFLVGALSVVSAQSPAEVPSVLDAHDIVWTSPSQDSSGAMPIGNGEAGSMVWCTKDGTLHCLLSRTDSFSEASRLLKLGIVRVRLRPVGEGEPFAQRLHLREGTISVRYGTGADEVAVRLFIDSEAPVLHIEGHAAQPVVVELDSWRRQPRRLAGDELPSSWTMKDAPDDVVVTESADVRVGKVGERVRLGFRHHNATSVAAFTAARQGLDPAVVGDPLLGRTFGCVGEIGGGNAGSMHADSPATLLGAAEFTAHIALPCLVAKTPAAFELAAAQVLDAADTASARERTARWWDAFWQRSWVFADLGGTARDTAAGGSRLTQALLLQRWVQACGGRGAFPIKFNGSIFTVEPAATGGQPFDADWRRWGDCFWWQNTRLPYYPMLAQGDFDMQWPLFRFYRDTLAAARHRVQRWHPEARGAYWPETMTPFGTHGNGDYGWQREGVPASKVLCPWWELTRNQGLELVALMLDRFDYERDPAFVRDWLVPIAEPVLAWFGSAYRRDDDGQLCIEPTQSLETFWTGVRDDLPTVAGLHFVLRGLLALPAELLAAAPVTEWQALLQALPPLPVHERNGVRMLAPAAAFEDKRSNCESPELYAVFPYRLFALGKPDLALATAAYERRHDRFTNGWPQDGQCAALLGYRDDAVANVLAKLQNAHGKHRFPVLWGPNFDWLPDQCHGSNLLDTVHRMLLQCDGDRIVVLPCWPADVDVTFKLHAPRGTTVECVWQRGRIERLVVEPKERRRDVVVPGPR